DVASVNCSPFKRGPSGDAVSPWAYRISLPKVFPIGSSPIHGSEPTKLPVKSVDISLLGIAKPACVLNQRIQHRLKIKGRPTNDFQNFAGRRLLLQGFREIAVARFKFFEQSHVLDGNHGLIGEGLKKGDL